MKGRISSFNTNALVRDRSILISLFLNALVSCGYLRLKTKTWCILLYCYLFCVTGVLLWKGTWSVFCAPSDVVFIDNNNLSYLQVFLFSLGEMSINNFLFYPAFQDGYLALKWVLNLLNSSVDASPDKVACGFTTPLDI